MAAEIIVISGFLGAGKTTLIQKWLSEHALPGKIAVVENDFGEVNVDAALLRSGDVVVSALSAGCICCSLSGDFVRALEELIVRYSPDTILVEPSGVGMLSDVLNACLHPRIQPLAHVVCAVTVVDVQRFHRYIDNFGAFFENQIRRADAILLSRVETDAARIPAVLERVISLNPGARVFASGWEALDAQAVLNRAPRSQTARVLTGRRSSRTQKPLREHPAEGTFDSVTIHCERVFTAQELHERLQQAEDSCAALIRAKGVLHTYDGHALVQYTQGETQIEPTFIEGGFLCLIGQGLDTAAIQNILCGE
jgi:G3E family GTPase